MLPMWCVDNKLLLKFGEITVDRHDYKRQTKYNYAYNLQADLPKGHAKTASKITTLIYLDEPQA